MRNASDTHWPRRLLGAASMLLAVLAIALAAVHACAPWLAARLAPAFAAAAGVDELALRIGRPGWNRLVVERLELARGPVRAIAVDGVLDYRPADLLRGRIAAATLARLTVVVDRAAAEQQPAPDTARAEAGGSAALPAPQALFDALPVDRVRIDRLELRVPRLDFVAVGRVDLDREALTATLHGVAPEPASRFVLDAALGRDGELRAALTDRDDGPPYLSATSRLSGNGLAIRAEADLRGYVLALASELAGAPAGAGRLAARLDGELPWPLPEVLDWRELVAGGTLELRWRAADVALELAPLTARWRLDRGRLRGNAQAQLVYRGAAAEVGVELAELDLRTADPRGSARLTLDAASTAPGDPRRIVTVDATLADAALSAQGELALAGTTLSRALDRAGLPPGEGALRASFDARLPWPPSSEMLQHLNARGEVSGHFEAEGAHWGLALTRAQWQLAGGALGLEAAGRAGYAGEALELALRLQPVALETRPWRLEGTVGTGALAAMPFRATVGDDGSGSLELTHRQALAGPLAAASLVGWSEPYDLDAGTLGLDVQLHWPAAEALGGTVRLVLDAVDAHYDDYRVEGLTGTLGFAAQRGSWRLTPSTLRAASLDAGVIARDLSTELAWADERVTVGASRAQLLGGRVRATPFDYRIATGSAAFTLALEGLSLAEVLALEGDDVSGRGTLDGTLPVLLEADRVSIVGGRVAARPPGGVIRLSPELTAGTGQPGLDFALTALRDFRFSELGADVDYAADGDLRLAVRLHGSNPEVEQGRPIHYNVNISENVPVLLESLRLQDRLTEDIERRLRN